MYLNKAIETIVTLYQLQIETGKRVSIELVSKPGVGKSEGIAQAAKLIGKKIGKAVDCKAFFLNSLEQPDVRGMPFPTPDHRRMIFTEAPWMPDFEGGDSTHGILNLDEFRQAPHDVQKPAAELLLNGAVGDSKLPITWMVITSSNREKDRSGVQREMAFLTNRVVRIEIEPRLDPWVDWAHKNNVHWAAIAFASHMPGKIFGDDVPKKTGPFCTPRSFVKASQLIGKFPRDIMTELLAGYVGEAVATEFAAFMRVTEEMPKFDDIIKSPKTAKLPDEDRPDAQWAVTQMLVHRVTGATAEAAFTYLSRLPREFQVAGVRGSVKHNKGALIKTPEFLKWVEKNEDLLIAANMIDN